MRFEQLLAGVAVILFIAAVPPYIIDILRGKTKPQRATWFIWSVLGIIAFTSQLMLGASWSLVFTGLDTFGSVLGFVLSLRFGVGGWAKLDRAALAVAAIGVFCSLLVQQPVIAILGVITADCSGTILTVRKAFRMPETETTISWILVGSGALCSVLAVGKLDISLLAYPAYLLIANYSIPVAQAAGRACRRVYKQPSVRAGQ